MYFYIPNHMYLTFFNDEIIFLDLFKNTYGVLTKDLSRIVVYTLKKNFFYVNGSYELASNKEALPEQFNEHIKILEKESILSFGQQNPFPHYLAKKFSPGAFDVDWKISKSLLDKKIPMKLILNALFTLVKVYNILYICGFYSLINVLKKKKKKINFFRTYDQKEIDELAASLTKACFYFPVRTKCLEWAATLAFMVLDRRITCTMEIGVQTNPFAAHAWVNVNGHVVADDPNLPERLSIILSEPFPMETQ